MHLSKLWAGGTNHLCRFINLYLRISVWYSRNWIELDTPYTAMTPRAAAVLKAALLLNQVNCCYHNYCKKNDYILKWSDQIDAFNAFLCIFCSPSTIRTINRPFNISLLCLHETKHHLPTPTGKCTNFSHLFTLPQSTLSYCCFCMQPSGDRSQNTKINLGCVC